MIHPDVYPNWATLVSLGIGDLVAIDFMHKEGRGVGAMAAILIGLVVRLTLLAVTPTLYGVPNNIFCFPNGLVSAGFDGWATLVAAAIAASAPTSSWPCNAAVDGGVARGRGVRPHGA